MNLLLLIFAGVVIVRTVCLASRMDHRRWVGHPAQFLALSLSHALLCAGALGVALCVPAAPAGLLIGLAGQVMFDRRRQDRRKWR